jgi:hypothetical protein
MCVVVHLRLHYILRFGDACLVRCNSRRSKPILPSEPFAPCIPELHHDANLDLELLASAGSQIITDRVAVVAVLDGDGSELAGAPTCSAARPGLDTAMVMEWTME